MKDYSKIFKVIFWIVTVFAVSIIVGVFLLLFVSGLYESMPGDDQLVLCIIIVGIPVVIMIAGLIGYLIYRDAKRLGMNAWMWLLIAIYAPNGIGIIIYLIVRFSEKKKKNCSQCGYPIKNDYLSCPKCGYKLKDSCSKCGNAIESDWQVCPHCNNALK